MTRVGIVVPVLDEESQIDDALRALRRLPEDWPVVVVDGGSRDRTVALAGASGARVLIATGGRGAQIAAGCEALFGDFEVDACLVLHVDVRLPESAAHWILDTLADRQWSAGAFRVRHRTSPACGPMRRRLIRCADLRSRISRHPYGDQAVFFCRGAYRAVGGVPLQPLMEDLELSRRLARRGRIRIVPAEVQVSARRFERRPLRTVLQWWTFPWLYRLGVSPQRLANWYGHSSA